MRLVLGRLLGISLALGIGVGTTFAQGEAKHFKSEIHEEAILLPSDADEWDSFLIYTPEVVENEGTYYLFYTGQADGADFASLSIGLATSTDGETWEKSDANPILMHQGTDPAMAPLVLVEEDTWVMYYSLPNNGGLPDRQIFRATASDPEGPWAFDETPVLEGGEEWDYYLTPLQILKTNDGYLLYYMGEDNFRLQSAIGVATSTDGLTWERHATPILTADPSHDWETFAVTSSIVFPTEDGFEMFYIGLNQRLLTPPSRYLDKTSLAYATSSDGISWEKSVDTPLIPTPESAYAFTTGIKIGETYYIYHDKNFGEDGFGLITLTAE